ncbi:response regulator [bacterium]|nr:response regulator [bacterium]
MSDTSVLVVEDERLVAEDIKTRLQDLGYRVHDIVDSGQKAVDILEQSLPDLILMDIILHGDLDGIQTAELIKSRHDIPIVYLTSHADQQTLRRVKDSQPSGYIIKPFIDEELYVVIETALYKNRMDAELRERKAWLSTILESIGDGVIATDLESRISFINPVAADLSEWKESRAVGKPVFDVFNAVLAEGRYQLAKVFEEVLKGEQFTARDDIFLSVPSGRQIPIEVNLAPIRNENNAILGVVLVFRDITQRRQVEADLEEERASLARRVDERTQELSLANAELARAVRLKDEFLANMSHELRTPLNAILGMSEALQENVYGDINSKQYRSLQIIQDSGRHLLSLINDILDISKIEAGKLEFERIPVDINGVIASSIAMVRQNAVKKQIQIHSHIQDTITTFLADERRLKQILVNLLSNAVKFTPEGGRIDLSVDSDDERTTLNFAVRDTGIGIAPEDMQRLFRPFEQLDSRLSRAHAGTGLGLALVRRLTELHGGGISLVSEQGRGSTFTVSIPFIDPETPTDQSQRDDGTTAGKSDAGPSAAGHILLAEDNEQNIMTIRDYLSKKGFTVTVARNGLEAVAALNPGIRLILMDIQMPGMDGLEAIRRIRSGSEYKKVPVIAISALAMPGDRDRCIGAGANEYLSKPVRLQSLLALIVSYLNSGGDH